MANTGTWLPGKKVLLSPAHLEALETGWVGNGFPTDLSKSQIEDSPDLKTDAPVLHQYEEEYGEYYQLPMYWADPYMYGSASGPTYVPQQSQEKSEADRQAHSA